jgi:hypothetical protein
MCAYPDRVPPRRAFVGSSSGAPTRPVWPVHHTGWCSGTGRCAPTCCMFSAWYLAQHVFVSTHIFRATCLICCCFFIICKLVGVLWIAYTLTAAIIVAAALYIPSRHCWTRTCGLCISRVLWPCGQVHVVQLFSLQLTTDPWNLKKNYRSIYKLWFLFFSEHDHTLLCLSWGEEGAVVCVLHGK